MRHRVNKIKFSFGRDSNRMLVRKLLKNFVTNSGIETTLKKAKVLKSVVDRLVQKSKVETESNRNFLLKAFNDEKLVEKMFKVIGTGVKGRIGGYVKIVRLGVLRTDGAETVRLEWTQPVAVEKKTEKKTNG